MTDSSSTFQVRILRKQQESKARFERHLNLKVRQKLEAKSQAVIDLVKICKLKPSEIEILIKFLEESKEFKRSNLHRFIPLLEEFQSEYISNQNAITYLVNQLRELQNISNRPKTTERKVNKVVNEIPPKTKITKTEQKDDTTVNNENKFYDEEEKLKLQTLKEYYIKKLQMFGYPLSRSEIYITNLMKISLSLINLIQDGKQRRGIGGFAKSPLEAYKEAFIKILCSYRELVIEIMPKISLESLDSTQGIFDTSRELIDIIIPIFNKKTEEQIIQVFSDIKSIENKILLNKIRNASSSKDKTLEEVTIIKNIFLSFARYSPLRVYNSSFVSEFEDFAEEGVNYCLEKVNTCNWQDFDSKSRCINEIWLIINDLLLQIKLNVAILASPISEIYIYQTLKDYLEVVIDFIKKAKIDPNKNHHTITTLMGIVETLLFNEFGHSYWDTVRISKLLENQIVLEFYNFIKEYQIYDTSDAQSIQKLIVAFETLINFCKQKQNEALNS